jgi:hypothetical protein
VATPAKKTPVDWEKARVEYEVAGDSYQVLGLRYGRSTAAMSKHGRRNGWVQNAEAAIRAGVSERTAGIGKVAAGNPEKREKAIDEAVDRRVAVIERHQTEWQAVRAMVYGALKHGQAQHADGKPDNDVRAAARQELRDAKTAATALSLVQMGERRAFNITQDTGLPGDNDVAFVWTDED